MPPATTETDEDDDDEETDNEDPMTRRRRIPYYFPRSWNSLSQWEDKRMTERRKRVSPYFYPNMRALRFLGHDVGYANPWRKRMVAVRKRDLLETLANDDPSAFGYDKKRKRFSGDDDEDDEDDEMEEMEEVGS